MTPRRANRSLVDHPARLDPQLAAQPWQRATLLFAVVAALELVLLIVAGGALLAKPGAAHRTTAKQPAPARTLAAAHRAAPAHATRAKPQPAPAAELPRGKVKLVVLNGNGHQGAAASAAARVQQRGYRVGLVANAPRHDYPQTIVMYRRGFEGEAQRLARDLGVHVVGPLDGMKPAQLHGAQAVLILGG
jgi:LytR cell envelope-related transcriptional attenuator